jgi:Domain of unknown function DUF11
MLQRKAPNANDFGRIDVAICTGSMVYFDQGVIMKNRFVCCLVAISLFVVGPLSANASTNQVAALLPGDAELTRVVIDRRNPDIAFATVSNYRPSMYQSKDGGQTWTPMTGLDCASIKCNAVAIDPTNSDHLLMASDRGIQSSNNAGLTWMSVHRTEDFAFVAFDPTRPQFAYTTTSDHKLYRSNNSGKTWMVLGTVPNDSIVDMAFYESQPARSLLLTQSGVYESNDGGQSWLRSTGLDNAALAVESTATADLVVTPSGTANFSYSIMSSPLNVTFRVKNNGPDSAAGARILLQLPTNLPLRSPDSLADGHPISAYNVGANNLIQHFPCAIGTSQAVCDIPQLATGETAEVAIYFQFQPPTGSNAVIVSASVESTVTDPNPQNNSATITATYGSLPISPPEPPTGNNALSGSHGGGAVNIDLILAIGLLAFIRSQCIRRAI